MKLNLRKQSFDCMGIRDLGIRNICKGYGSGMVIGLVVFRDKSAMKKYAWVKVKSRILKQSLNLW